MAVETPNGTGYGEILNSRTDVIYSYNSSHALQANARGDDPLAITATSPRLSDTSTQAMMGHERLYDISSELTQGDPDLLRHPYILDPSMRAEMGHYWFLDPSIYALHAPFDPCPLPQDMCMAMTSFQQPCTVEDMHNPAQNLPARPIFGY